MEISINKKNWNLSVDKEREIWKKEYLNTFIPVKNYEKNVIKDLLA